MFLSIKFIDLLFKNKWAFVMKKIQLKCMLCGEEKQTNRKTTEHLILFVLELLSANTVILVWWEVMHDCYQFKLPMLLVDLYRLFKDSFPVESS